MKKNIYPYRARLMWLVVGFVLVLMVPQRGYASHAMGADLTYECLPGDSLLIRLTVYRDCQGSPLNPQQPIFLGSQACGYADTVILADRVSVTVLPVICPGQQALSSCSGGVLPGAEEHIYEVRVGLPQQCPDWRIGWAICCRNGAITNSSVDPAATDLYIEATFDNTLSQCNNSPEFYNDLVPYLCVNEPFQFDAGANDPDGDSLAYELVDPLDYDYNAGTSFPVPYLPGFSFNNPMSTTGGFSFDPATGYISFTPNSIQVGIVAILVKEYRNGQLIATTRRDMQMIVLPCSNEPPVIDQPTNISGGQFNGNTFSVCAGNTLTFNINGREFDGDVWDFCSPPGATAPGASFTGNIVDSVMNTTFIWPTTPQDTGVYYLNLCVRDEGCPRPLGASVGYRIIVRPAEVLPQEVINFCPSTQDSVNPLTSIPPVPNATYTWIPATGLSNPNVPNPRIEAPLQPTTYTLIQTSPSECARTQSFLIRPGANIVVPSDTLVICQGDTIPVPVTVTFPGAPANFTLSWAPADTLVINNPNSTAPLIYPSTSTDFVILAATASCQYEANLRVEVERPPQLDALTDDLICYGDTTTLSATGSNLGNATLQWLPSTTLSQPNQLTTLAAPLATTTYQLRATNLCGVDSTPVEVEVAAPLNLNAAAQDLNCAGSNDGQLDVVPQGGLGPFAYSLSPNPNGINFTGTATNLPPGTYQVTAVDQAGCLDTLFTTIEEPDPLLLNLDTLLDVDCFGNSSGRIDLSATGGTPGYQFSLNGPSGPYQINGSFPGLLAGTYDLSARDQNGCTADLPGVIVDQPANPVDLVLDNVVNASCNDSLGLIAVTASGGNGVYEFFLNGDSVVAGGNNYTFTNLPPSTYVVTVEDSNGCSNDLPVQIVELTDPVAVLDSVQPTDCFGEGTGQVNITVLEGVPPYAVSFQGSPFTTYNPPSDSLTLPFDSLSAGWYQFVVEDQNDCLFSLNFEVTQPDTFLFEVSAYVPPLCAGGNDGQALFRGFGGTPPYDFQLGSTLQDSGFFEGLSQGSYPFTLIDSRGCQTTDTVVLDDPPPLAGFATVDNVSCPGAADGWVNVRATGGTPNYEFAFDGPGFVENDSFPNLLAGTYTIVVQDDHGCLDSLTATVLEPNPLELLANTVEDVDCFGAATGSATLQGRGGTPPYQYGLPGGPFLSNNQLSGLPQGSYVVLMRDANGCLIDAEIEIDEPFALRGDVTSQPVLCYGDSNGRAEVAMVGGTAPYAYRWSNGETTALATQLPPGNPTVTVTDANGCTYAISAEVLEPPEMSFDTTAQGDVSCFGGNDGFVLAEAQGGTPPYDYEWSGGGTGTQLSPIPAGDYVITVTDSNGCPIQDTLVVQQPEPIEIEVEIEPAICGTPSGAIEIFPSGGTGELQIQWADAQTTSRIENLLGGPEIPPYEVLIVDENGCELLEAIELEESGEPVADFLHAFQPLDSFLLPPKGVQFINRSVEGVEFLWAFGDNEISNEKNPLHVYAEPGTYEVTLVVFDPFFSCPDTQQRVITLLPPGDIFVPNVFTPNGDGHNDTWSPRGAGVVRAETNVYSRWGELIITLPSLSFEWDGDHPRTGGPAQEGVYVWVVRALLNDGTWIERAGTVTLVH